MEKTGVSMGGKIVDAKIGTTPPVEPQEDED